MSEGCQGVAVATSRMILLACLFLLAAPSVQCARFKLSGIRTRESSSRLVILTKPLVTTPVIESTPLAPQRPSAPDTPNFEPPQEEEPTQELQLLPESLQFADTGLVGCYVDGEDRAFPDLAALYEWSEAMTVERCRRLAWEAGIIFFGVENGRECFGGNDLSHAVRHGRSSACTAACRGDESQMCGGDGAISIYVTAVGPAPVPSPPPPRTQGDYVGCFADSLEHRSLPDLHEVSELMTVDRCRRFALEHGFAYFGLEAGRECYAGSDLIRALSLGVSPRSCTWTCAGSDLQLCGGNLALSVYRTPLLPVDANQGLGQGKLARATKVASLNSLGHPFQPAGSPSLSQGSVRGSDSAATSTSATSTSATSTYTSAFASAAATSVVATSTDVSTAVSGSAAAAADSAGWDTFERDEDLDYMYSTQYSYDKPDPYGDVYEQGHDSVYDYPSYHDSEGLAADRDSDDVWAPWRREGYLGCFTGGSNRVFASYGLQYSESELMTTDLCRDLAQMEGMLYYGLASGTTCYRGNELTVGLDRAGSPEECALPCSGDLTQACGGRGVIAVYVTLSTV